MSTELSTIPLSILYVTELKNPSLFRALIDSFNLVLLYGSPSSIRISLLITESIVLVFPKIDILLI